MKSNTLIFLFFILFTVGALSNEIKRDTIFERYDIVLLCSVDDIYYKVERIKNKDQYVSYVDTMNVNKFRLYDDIFRDGYLNLSKNKIYFYKSGNNKTIYCWDIKFGKFTLIDSVQGTILGFKGDYMFFGKPVKFEIGAYDPGTTFPYVFPIYSLKGIKLGNKSAENIIELKDEKEEFFGITNVISFTNEEDVLICGGLLMGDASCQKAKYILYNLKTHKVRDFDKVNFKNYKDNFSVNGLSSSFYFDLEDNLFINTSIYNSKFDYLGESLIPDCNIFGYDIKNNKLVSFYVSSETDQKVSRTGYRKVIIPFKKLASVEIVYYKIINNELLTSEDFNDLEIQDLQMLYNMIYAKYNFAFSDAYLQAYFNLYFFYKKGRENRKSNVDSFFSETDKTNLQIIDKKRNLISNSSSLP